MRLLLTASLLVLCALPCRAEVLDCRDYMARFDGMMAEVAARAPGNETDARREKAEGLVRECKRMERREAREAMEQMPVPERPPLDCVWRAGRLVCR